MELSFFPVSFHRFSILPPMFIVIPRNPNCETPGQVDGLCGWFVRQEVAQRLSGSLPDSSRLPDLTRRRRRLGLANSGGNARNVSIHSTAAVSAVTDHSSVPIMRRRVKAEARQHLALFFLRVLSPSSIPPLLASSLFFCFPAATASQKHACYRCAKRLTLL